MVIFLSFLLARNANAHSHMLEPLAYNARYTNFEFPNGCKPFRCPACPDMRKDPTTMVNDPTNPAARWSRGELVTVRWARNNHRGGFVRLAFVPVSRMMEHAAQQQFAFYYGCWDQNEHVCNRSPCGADKLRHVYQRQIVVPAVIPDDVYTLAWAWFGGIDSSREKARFADYYSCSFVRIEGGIPLQDSYQPFFDTGNGTTVPGKCQTGNTQPGVCTQIQQCDGPVWFDVPSVFQDGRKPAVITSSMYGAGGTDEHPDPSDPGLGETGSFPSYSPAATVQPVLSSDPSLAPTFSPWLTTDPSLTPLPDSPSIDPSLSPDIPFPSINPSLSPDLTPPSFEPSFSSVFSPPLP